VRPGSQKIRWLLLTRSGNLRDEQRFRLRELLRYKAKVTTRKSYGFRTYRVLELALYHSVGKLPEPKSTHDLF
jgi:hypothetical protein